MNETDLAISEIATRLGFSSQNHFYYLISSPCGSDAEIFQKGDVGPCPECRQTVVDEEYPQIAPITQILTFKMVGHHSFAF